MNPGEMIQIKVIKHFKTPVDKVFDAWLDTDFLSKWMFGPDVRDEEVIKLENHPEEGGHFSYIVRRGDEELNHTGTYREVQRPNRLVFTWGVDEEAGDESVVTIQIESTDKGCRLMLIHELGAEWTEYADRTQEGWSYMLNKLEELLSNNKIT